MSIPQEILTLRQSRILRALVETHIHTKKPVSSRSIATSLRGKWSSATIRSELATLTDWGFIAQPHTSAGRIPTVSGFRSYVDGIGPRNPTLPHHGLEAMQVSPAGTTLEWVRRVSSSLSNETQLPGVAIQPSGDAIELKKLEFIYLEPARILAILVTSSGDVFHHRIEWKNKFHRRELEHFNNYLGETMNGRSLVDIRHVIEKELERDRVRADFLLRSALELCSTVIDASHDPALFFHGQDSLLMMTEFDTLDEVRAIIAGMSRKDLWLALLDRTLTTPGVQLIIGSESCIAGLENCSIIVAPYGTSLSGRGALGVFGPMNMQYTKMIPLVNWAAQLLDHQLREIEGWPRSE